MNSERGNAHDGADATIVRGARHEEFAEAHGRYEIECIGPDGSVKWRDVIENVVCTEGKNLALDTFLAGGANAPTYTGNRKTAAFSSAAAGAKALSSALSFAITGSGTVKGCFVLYGSAALATKDDAHGTLWSAGLFSGGDKIVANLDTLNVSYSSSL